MIGIWKHEEEAETNFFLDWEVLSRHEIKFCRIISSGLGDLFRITMKAEAGGSRDQGK